MAARTTGPTNAHGFGVSPALGGAAEAPWIQGFAEMSKALTAMAGGAPTGAQNPNPFAAFDPMGVFKAFSGGGSAAATAPAAAHNELAARDPMKAFADMMAGGAAKFGGGAEGPAAMMRLCAEASSRLATGMAEIGAESMAALSASRDPMAAMQAQMQAMESTRRLWMEVAEDLMHGAGDATSAPAASAPARRA